MNYMAGIPEGEKVICHAGWYHAIEVPIKKRGRNDNYWLAYELKQLAKIDPLTVYQDALNYKRSAKQGSSPYYEYLEDRMNGSTKPLVLVNQDNEAWQGPGDSLPFDIVTIQPRMNYDFSSNRLPWDAWNCSACDTRQTKIDLFALNVNVDSTQSYLIELRRDYESPLATPVYAKEVSKENGVLDLNLCVGPYKVTYIDREGKRYEAKVSI